MTAPPAKIVDLKLPLHWLIGAAASACIFMITLAWQAAGQSGKLDQIILANAKLEKRLDDRDVRLDALRDSVYEMRRHVDMNALRIATLEGRAK